LNVKIELKGQSGNHAKVKTINNKDGTWNVEFKPTEIGDYYIDIFWDNNLINNTPYKCNIFDPSKIKITPTLSGVIGHVVKFEGKNY
jgi:hypothetical protein